VLQSLIAYWFHARFGADLADLGWIFFGVQILSGISLLLAALGLYGVLAYAVRQRTREMGIRMALGSTAAQVRGLVLRQAAAVLGIGLAVGIAGAAVLGRWLTSLAFEISPWDPRIFLATASLLTITALVATWLPARRASRMEPRIAMQQGECP